MAFSTRHFQAHHSGARRTERGAVPVRRWNSTSGGVASTADLKALKPLAADGVVGAISGKALYTGALDFTEGMRLLQTE